MELLTSVIKIIRNQETLQNLVTADTAEQAHAILHPLLPT